jgi:hypothetical protein
LYQAHRSSTGGEGAREIGSAEVDPSFMMAIFSDEDLINRMGYRALPRAASK